MENPNLGQHDNAASTLRTQEPGKLEIKVPKTMPRYYMGSVMSLNRTLHSATNSIVERRSATLERHDWLSISENFVNLKKKKIVHRGAELLYIWGGCSAA